MINEIRGDIYAALNRDPALKRSKISRFELFLYQGLHAIVLYRFAHFLWNLSIPFIPRLISQLARFLTGIEIHPGAQIGKGCFIDHGSGVVIGETAIVGENALIYHQVTLGGTSLEATKRHPTIGNDVMIGAGAKLFGPIKVGNNCQIGGGTVLTKDIPDNSIVVGNPARTIKCKGVKVIDSVDTMNMPDPLKEYLEKLEKRVKEHESRK